MKIGIPEQQDHPLAPNRPLEPITWRQARAEPHGYYERTAYADGWNDAVSKAKELIAKYETIIAHMYQIAGAYNMPEDILDILCDPAETTLKQIDAMLPHMPKMIYQYEKFPKIWEDVSGKDFNMLKGLRRRAVLDLNWPDDVPVKE